MVLLHPVKASYVALWSKSLNHAKYCQTFLHGLANYHAKDPVGSREIYPDLKTWYGSGNTRLLYLREWKLRRITVYMMGGPQLFWFVDSNWMARRFIRPWCSSENKSGVSQHCPSNTRHNDIISETVLQKKRAADARTDSYPEIVLCFTCGS